MRFWQPRWRIRVDGTLPTLVPYSQVLSGRFWLRSSAEVEAALMNQRATYTRYTVIDARESE